MKIKEWIDSITTASIRISNDCQLRCKYCYFFNECNSINNKTFPIKDIDKIFNIFPNINSLEFWGAETLIKIDDMIEAILFIDKNIEIGNKVIHYLASSNFAYTEDQIIKIFNKLVKLDSELNNNISFYIQASIDFPNYNHDDFRVDVKNNKTFDLCYSGYRTFCKLFETYKFKNILFGIGTKGTYDITTITKENASNIVKDVMKYMDSEVNDILYLKDKCNIDIGLSHLPTFFNYKSANNNTKIGILTYYNTIFTEAFSRVSKSKIPVSFIWYYLGRDIEKFINTYIKVSHIKDFNDENTIFLNCYFSRVASIDYNGNIVPCHRAFTGNNFDNYVFGNIYENNFNEELILKTLEDTKYFSNFYKQFKDKLFNHPEFNKELIYCYFQLLSSCICYADCINDTGKITEDNLLNYMNAYPIELALLIKEYIDEFKDFFIINYIEQ